MTMNLSLLSEHNTFMIPILLLAFLICHKNSLLHFLKSNTTAKKRYPDGVTRSRYEEEGARGSGEECSICLCDIKRGDEIIQLPCHHFFHALCLEKWLLSYGHLTCPFCRASLSHPSSSSSPSSSTTTVLYSESEAREVISFNLFSKPSSRGRNSWGLM